MSNVKIYERTADCDDLIRRILESNREVDIMGQVDPFAIECKLISLRLDEPRLMNAIGVIASKLGANVTNYNQ